MSSTPLDPNFSVDLTGADNGLPYGVDWYSKRYATKEQLEQEGLETYGHLTPGEAERAMKVGLMVADILGETGMSNEQLAPLLNFAIYGRMFPGTVVHLNPTANLSTSTPYAIQRRNQFLQNAEYASYADTSFGASGSTTTASNPGNLGIWQQGVIEAARYILEAYVDVVLSLGGVGVAWGPNPVGLGPGSAMPGPIVGVGCAAMANPDFPPCSQGPSA